MFAFRLARLSIVLLAAAAAVVGCQTDTVIVGEDVEGIEGATCSDGVDNDGDGLADCDDPDCAGAGEEGGTPVCDSFGEQCASSADCGPSSCCFDGWCLAQEQDDDGDGSLNCDDVDPLDSAETGCDDSECGGPEGSPCEADSDCLSPACCYQGICMQPDVDGNDDGVIDCSDPSPSVCGDGLVSPGEQCDDGNGQDGDGCDSTCLFEISCETEDDCGSESCCRSGICVDQQADHDGDGTPDCEEDPASSGDPAF